MKTIITENLQNTQRYITHTLETRLKHIETKTLLTLSVDVTKFLKYL